MKDAWCVCKGTASGGARRHFVVRWRESPKMAEMVSASKSRPKRSGVSVSPCFLRKAIRTYGAFVTRV